MQILELLLDVVIGILLAGVIAPLVLFTLPDQARSSSVLLIVAVACIVVAALLRRLFVRPSRTSDAK